MEMTEEKFATELAELKSVCRRLWPFVRYFGLCGAHPDAISAVADLAAILDADGIAEQSVTEACQKVEQETIHYVAESLEAVLRGKVMAREIPDIIDKIRQLPPRTVT